MSVIDASMTKFDLWHAGIQVDKKKVHINPTLLFSRLIAIVQREEDMAPFFNYELTQLLYSRTIVCGKLLQEA